MHRSSRFPRAAPWAPVRVPTKNPPRVTTHGQASGPLSQKEEACVSHAACAVPLRAGGPPGTLRSSQSSGSQQCKAPSPPQQSRGFSVGAATKTVAPPHHPPHMKTGPQMCMKRSPPPQFLGRSLYSGAAEEEGADMPDARGEGVINKDLEFQENTACWSSAEGT